jgi:hypothetical protein
MTRRDASRASLQALLQLGIIGGTAHVAAAVACSGADASSSAASSTSGGSEIGYHLIMQPFTVAKQWYVSFVPAGRKAGRTTRTFETEKQAKAFALQNLAKGFAPSAGTLNPHLPKRTISSSEADTWARSE